MAPKVTSIVATPSQVGSLGVDREFLLTITFDQLLSDSLDATELSFGGNASTVSVVTHAIEGTSPNQYIVSTVTIQPKHPFEGTVTITVEAGAVQNTSGEANAAASEPLEVDNKPPELERATVDGTRLALYYHEEFDERQQGSAGEFTVSVTPPGTTTPTTVTPDSHRVKDDSVVLTLPATEAVGAGDEVTLAYNGTSIIDLRGNPLATFTAQAIENLNSGENRYPTAVRNLIANAVNSTSIKLDWKEPASAGAGTNVTITGYRIEASPNGTGNWIILAGNTGNADTTYTDSGLTANTTRYYRVFAINSAGLQGPSSSTASATTGEPPGAPTGLKAAADGPNAIDLNWTAPTTTGTSAITGYRIEVSVDGGTNWTVRVANTGNTNTSYKHTGLTAGTTRHYRVSAINNTGVGPASGIASATTTIVITAPDPPTLLSATALGTDRIRLSWTAPANNGGSAITGYRIERSNDGNTGWTDLVANTGNTNTTFTDTGLNPGTTRHYRVSAINTSGTSTPSNTANATTEAGDVPGAPTNLQATSVGDDAIRLEWTAPSDAGSSAISGYKIEHSPNGTTAWTNLVSNTNNTSTVHTDRGLQPGTTRHYRVSAINGAGTGPVSNVSNATTATGPPDPPRNLRAVPNGSDQIDLSWTEPADDNGSPVTGYRIQVSDDAGATWGGLASTGASVTSYSHTGLDPATTRHYRVFASSTVGESQPSNEANATTEANVPGRPTGLTATPQGSNRINLSWSPPTDNGGSAITSYRIEITPQGGSPRTIQTGSAATTYPHTGLAPGSTWRYRVSAVNSAGSGAWSLSATATTDANKPSAPTRLAATTVDSATISLQWQAPSSNGGADITGYQIEARPHPDSTWTIIVQDTNDDFPSYLHTGLAPGTTRYYRVAAINSAGVGPASNVASATTNPVLPGVPTNLDATAAGQTQIDLVWDAPADDGGADIRGYRIEMSKNGQNWTILQGTTGTSETAWSHRGLEPATTLHYRVRAITRAGIGPASNSASATTDAAPPDAPTDLTATARGTSQIEIEWTAPEYSGGVPLIGYRIEVSEDGSRWEILEAEAPLTPTEYTHRGLAPATTRHYRVSAINSADLVGDPSEQVSATTDARAPDAPTNLMAAADGTSRIDLNWTAPEYDGGAPVTGYRIEVSVDRGLVWRELVANTNNNRTTYAHTGLAPATTRYYRVSAINRVGPGDASNEAHATTDATVPDAPTALTATAEDHQQIDLDWDAPPFDGGAAISGYRIEVSENAGSTWTDLVANTGTNATKYSHTGLDPASTRHYRVSAINEIGTGDASNVASATTDAIAPDPPTNLVATATLPTRIELEWVAPAYDGGAPVVSYRVEVSEDGITWADLQPSTGVSLTQFAHTGLPPGSTRHYRVSAINIAGVGLPSNTASATTDDPVERAGRVNQAILPHFAAAATTSSLSAISRRIETVASRNPLQSQLSAAGLLSRAGAMERSGGLNMGRLFDGMSFATTLESGAQDVATPAGFTTWGGAEYTAMGEPGGSEVEWEGNMLSVHVGADMRIHRDILVGVAGSRSVGNYDFTDVTGAREIEGTYEARMMSLNPYVAWLPGRTGVAAWAAGTFGWGDVTVEDEPGGQRGSDTRSMGGAVGGTRILMTTGASALRMRAEGWMSQVKVDGSEGMDALTLDMHRLRVALEWSQVQELGGGREVNFLAEGGLRYGDGDGTEGAGMELGGGLRFTSGTRALTVEGHGRVLATSPNDYEEWGVRGLIQIEPQAMARGLSVRVAPAWGQSASGVQELWERGVSQRPDMSHALQRGRVNTRVEYGLGDFGGTPYGRIYLADDGARAFGTGMRYSLTRVLDLRLEGTRTESGTGPARHGLAMRGRWVF